MTTDDLPKIALSPVSPQQLADLERQFGYHRPTGTKDKRHGEVRDRLREMGAMFLCLCPPSPERDMAVEKLREAMFWANASIACHPEPEPVK